MFVWFKLPTSLRAFDIFPIFCTCNILDNVFCTLHLIRATFTSQNKNIYLLNKIKRHSEIFTTCVLPIIKFFCVYYIIKFRNYINIFALNI